VTPNHASILSAHALYGVSQCVCVVISAVTSVSGPRRALRRSGRAGLGAGAAGRLG
jgi:hypothetical protein